MKNTKGILYLKKFNSPGDKSYNSIISYNIKTQRNSFGVFEKKGTGENHFDIKFTASDFTIEIIRSI